MLDLGAHGLHHPAELVAQCHKLVAAVLELALHNHNQRKYASKHQGPRRIKGGLNGLYKQ